MTTEYKDLMLFYDTNGCAHHIDYESLSKPRQNNIGDLSEFARYSEGIILDKEND